MRIVPAGDVLNVMPFAIAVALMQPSARLRAYIHEGFVRELTTAESRDCITAAGACVSCEPVNMLPHAPEVESGTQGEFYRPELQITHLVITGTRYLVDVTTVDATAATYRSEASKVSGQRQEGGSKES